VDQLTIAVERRGRWTVVRPAGPLDVANAPALRQRLVEVQVPAGVAVLVDLDAVEYLDSMGLGVLVGALKRARETDGELVLRCTRDRILRLLELTGLDTVLRVVADPDEVVAAS
jgi:anti-sigma B factor antagonist